MWSKSKPKPSPAKSDGSAASPAETSTAPSQDAALEALTDRVTAARSVV